ncbi:hypothetical protein ACU686_02765 [Yinghuangia aomiensis]
MKRLRGIGAVLAGALLLAGCSDTGSAKGGKDAAGPSTSGSGPADLVPMPAAGSISWSQCDDSSFDMRHAVGCRSTTAPPPAPRSRLR